MLAPIPPDPPVTSATFFVSPVCVAAAAAAVRLLYLSVRVHVRTPKARYRTVDATIMGVVLI